MSVYFTLPISKTKITDSPDGLVDGLLGLVSARCLLGLLGEVGHHVTDTGGGGVSGHSVVTGSLMESFGVQHRNVIHP